ncbi:phage portal protein [Cohaesibacter sp. CAU 1516]|uniref:phage portal protein n=1 Tax=Cohaesibacter sp. CAU 1516 TaxID=2576038 RepID=UPI00148551C6|nr:phage portal protein [Cohaesibacter sp. CAU 1516]
MGFLWNAAGALASGQALQYVRYQVGRSIMGQRSYAAEMLAKRFREFVAPRTSANAEVRPSAGTVRANARQAVRDNPVAERIVRLFEIYLIGRGIKTKSRTGVKTLDKKTNKLFDQWAEVADFGGEETYYGLQRLVVRAMAESGAVLIVYRWDRDFPVLPLRLQVLEIDHLDHSKDGPLPQGGRIDMGIEFDRHGRRVAYHIYDEHPGEAISYDGFQSTRFLSEDVIHLYRKDRPGQINGVSWLAPVLPTLKDLNEFFEAALVKAKIEACFAVFRQRPQAGGAVLPGAKDESGGPSVSKISPGVIIDGKPGEEFKAVAPSSNSSFEMFVTNILMLVGIGVSMTYDLVSGDMRKANYSSMRAGRLPFYRFVLQTQELLLIPRFCSRVQKSFIFAAVLKGELKPRKGGYPADFVPPVQENLDPIKDMQADILAVKAGAMPPQEFTARWGRDFDDVVAKFVEADQVLKDAGVRFDYSGNVNAKAQTDDPPDDADDDDKKGDDDAQED